MGGYPRLALTQVILIWRNPNYWAVSLVFPIMSMLMFGFLFEDVFQPKHVVLGLTDHDDSSISRQLEATLQSSPAFRLFEGEEDDEMRALEDGRRWAVMVIPAGFAESVQETGARLKVFYDNSNPFRARTSVDGIEAVVRAMNDSIVSSQDPISLEQEGLKTTATRHIDYLTPGMIGMTIMWANLFAAINLVWWRQLGILRRLGVTPLHPAALISSQVVALIALSLLQALVLVVTGRLVFDVRVEGDYFALLSTLLLGILAMQGVAYIMAAYIRSPLAVGAVANLVAIPMMFLGGSFFPTDSAPSSIQPLIRVLPLHYLNDALHQIYNQGHGFSSVWPSLAILGVWAMGAFLMSSRIFRWE